MLFLDAGQVNARLSYQHAIPLMHKALIQTSQGQVIQPARTIMSLPLGSGMALMPGGFQNDRWFGVKAVARFAATSTEGRHSKSGVFLLFDQQEKNLVAVIDAEALTLIRTAATTVVATVALAQPGPWCIGLLGCGELARAHMMAFLSQGHAKSFVIWGRSSDKAFKLADEFQDCGVPVRVAELGADVVDQADVICAVSAANEPILQGDWLRPGQHVNAIGSSTLRECEVDTEVLRRSALFVDSLPAAQAAAAELNLAIEQQLMTWDNIRGELGDVLSKKKEGRKTHTEITFFKSLGLFAEDCLAASCLVTDDQELSS